MAPEGMDRARIQRISREWEKVGLWGFMSCLLCCKEASTVPVECARCLSVFSLTQYKEVPASYVSFKMAKMKRSLETSLVE